MTKEIEDYLQTEYENILSEYWNKILQIRELNDTNTNNHPLRQMSIEKRLTEFNGIMKKRDAMELLYYDWIDIPEWFNEVCDKHNIAKES